MKLWVRGEVNRPGKYIVKSSDDYDNNGTIVYVDYTYLIKDEEKYNAMSEEEREKSLRRLEKDPNAIKELCVIESDHCYSLEVLDYDMYRRIGK